MRLLLLVILALPLYFFSGDSVIAQELVCPFNSIDQITDTDGGVSEDPTISATGRYVAFRSNWNFNDNTTYPSSQVYLFDRATRIQTQITDDPDEASLGPSINANGDYVAFHSRADINNQGATTEFQVYVFNVISGIFTQITDDLNDSSFFPSISDNGMHVAFHSDADFTGENPNGINQVFLANVNDGTIVQISQDVNFSSREAKVSGNANIIVFRSDADFTGQNPDNRPQIFIYNVSTDTYTQVSEAGLLTSALQSDISTDGRFVVYRSTQNVNGGNPDENSEIFLYEIAAATITQITFTGNGEFNQNPSTNADGSRIAFESAANFNGNNPNLIREIWVYDVTNEEFVQATDVQEGLSEHARISADGLSVAFESRSDIGNNPDLRREVYVANCFLPRNVPTLSEWGLITMAGILGLVGFFIIRRRAVAL